MIVNLSGIVDNEMFTTLVKSFNDLKVNDNLHVYLTTEGGDADTAEAIIDLINKNKDYIGITFYGEIFSAGMHIFLKSQCQRYLLPDTRGMYHFSYQKLQIAEGGNGLDIYDRFCIQEMKDSKSRTIEYLKSTPLTEKEITGIKKGRDVY